MLYRALIRGSCSPCVGCIVSRSVPVVIFAGDEGALNVTINQPFCRLQLTGRWKKDISGPITE